MTQLALPLQLADHAVFDSFLDTGNETLVATLRELGTATTDGGCWLWGSPSTGKTHLLQAVCDAFDDRAVYLPMSLLKDAGPEVLEGLTSRDIICIDDIDAVIGGEDWENALFALLNQAADWHVQLVISALAAPREQSVNLPDLQSRFMRLPVFQIHELNDAARAAALQLRSKHRGLTLPDETAQYLLRRSQRDMTSLYEILDRLDREALRAKRRLTIPFVRGVLDAESVRV